MSKVELSAYCREKGLYPEQVQPPYPLSAILRVHCLQLFDNLSDPAMEDALYEIESMRHLP